MFNDEESTNVRLLCKLAKFYFKVKEALTKQLIFFSSHVNLNLDIDRDNDIFYQYDFQSAPLFGPVCSLCFTNFQTSTFIWTPMFIWNL